MPVPSKRDPTCAPEHLLLFVVPARNRNSHPGKGAVPRNHHEPNALSPSTSTQVAPATRHHLRHHSLLYPSPLRLRSLQQPRWRSRARRQVLPSSTTSDAVSCLLLCRSHLPHCLYRTMRRRRATAGCWLIRSGRGSVREWGWRWTGKVTEGEEVRVVAVAEMTTRMTFE